MLKSQFDMNSSLRVIIYSRMSHDSQNPRSPDQQIQVIRDLIARRGLPWSVIATFRDDAISGRYLRRRPAYQKMLSALKSRELRADLVLVDTFERLTRADDASLERRKFQKLGILVLTADSDFSDPTSVAGKALAFIEAYRATEDGRVKAHNVLRGKKDAIKQGHWPGGPPPFGYRLKNIMIAKNGVEEIDHRVLVPDPIVRLIATKIFRIADETGWGTNRLAKHMNADPSISEDFKPFHPATIGEMLDNPIYVRELVWGRNRTGIVDDVRILQRLPKDEWIRDSNFCEPLVERDVFNRIQGVRNARRRRSRSASEQLHQADAIAGLRAPGLALKYPLSGLVRCDVCGRSMTPSSSRAYNAKSGESRRYVTYVCPAAPSGMCTNHTGIPESWLRDVVADLIRRRLLFTD